MTVALQGGPVVWEGERDRDGYRTYKVNWRVLATAGEGPAAVMQCPGLPLPGSVWGPGSDIDVWATCKLDTTVKPHSSYREGEAAWAGNVYWTVGQTFTTKNDEKRCKDEQVDDPLLEPQKVSGDFKNYTEEIVVDRYGCPVVNSAFERFRGPQVEFDNNRPTVKVEQNVANLALNMCAGMVDTVNLYNLWGFPPRCVKLSNFSWERLFRGTCYVYYKRTFEFEIRYEGWDRNLLDEGTKVLRGHWATLPGECPTEPDKVAWVLDKICGQTPNPNDPSHFIRFVDRNGSPANVVLDGAGLPADAKIGTSTARGDEIHWDRVIWFGDPGFSPNTGTGTGTGSDNPGASCTSNIPATNAGQRHVEKYRMSDFTYLDIPTKF